MVATSLNEGRDRNPGDTAKSGEVARLEGKSRMKARSVPRNRRESDQFRMLRGPDSSKSSGLGANLPSDDRNQAEKDASLRVRKQLRVAKAPQRRGPVSGRRSS